VTVASKHSSDINERMLGLSCRDPEAPCFVWNDLAPQIDIWRTGSEITQARIEVHAIRSCDEDRRLPDGNLRQPGRMRPGTDVGASVAGRSAGEDRRKSVLTEPRSCKRLRTGRVNSIVLFAVGDQEPHSPTPYAIDQTGPQEE
jgi:hypothetical protein